jgi:hypothetical protein
MLATEDKIYAATHRYVQREGGWRGAFRIDRLYGQVPVDLHSTLTGEGPAITLDIADDFGAHKPTLVQLRLRVNEWTNKDAVRVEWDGEELEAPQIDYCRLDQDSPPGGAFLARRVGAT